MNVIAFAQAVGCHCTARLAVRPRIGQQNAITFPEERLTVSRNATTVVADSVKQNDCLAILMFRHAVPGMQLDTIRSLNNHGLQVSPVGRVHS